MLLIHTEKLSLFQAEEVLRKVKNYLASGHPAMFGFMVYNSIEQADASGRIPFPEERMGR